MAIESRLTDNIFLVFGKVTFDSISSSLEEILPSLIV